MNNKKKMNRFYIQGFAESTCTRETARGISPYIVVVEIKYGAVLYIMGIVIRLEVWERLPQFDFNT